MSVKFEFDSYDESGKIEFDTFDEEDSFDEEDEEDGFECDLSENMAQFAKKRTSGNTEPSDDDDECDDEEEGFHDYCEPYLKFSLSESNLKVLRKIISTIEDSEWEQDRYDWHDEKGETYEDYRYVDMFALQEDEDGDVFELVRNLFERANDDNFNYDINEDLLDIQLLRYKEGGQYNWHCDYGLSVESQRGMTRKLSMSIQLSEQTDYEGGELEFIDYCGRHPQLEKYKGAGIIFDSRLPHKANPLTSGERLILIAWAHGPQLR